MINCFETVEFRNRLFFAIPAHLDRLARCASIVGLPDVDRDSITAVLESLRHKMGASPARIRIAWNDRSLTTVVSSPLLVPTRLAALAFDDLPRVMSTSVLAGLKTNSYVSATAYMAAQPSADEVLVTNEHGQVCGGAYSNLFIVVAGRVLTPPLTSGCRDGVTRSLLLEHLPEVGIEVRETPLSVEDVRTADEAFICSTGRHVHAVGSISWSPSSEETTPGERPVARAEPISGERPLTEATMRVFEELQADDRLWS